MPIFVGLGIPLIFLIAGAIGKKLVRGAGWRLEDFFLGTELTLAAMSASLIHIFDLLETAAGSPKTALAAGHVAISFCLFLIVLSLHQDFSVHTNRRNQLFWLAGVSNLIGFALMFLFVLLVKGA